MGRKVPRMLGAKGISGLFLETHLAEMFVLKESLSIVLNLSGSWGLISPLRRIWTSSAIAWVAAAFVGNFLKQFSVLMKNFNNKVYLPLKALTILFSATSYLQFILIPTRIAVIYLPPNNIEFRATEAGCEETPF
jgi:hypothetical protein